MLCRFFHAPLHIGTNSCRRRVENRDFVLLDDFPHAIIRRVIGNAFIHHLSCAITEWPVDDVAMASDPANISRAPENIFFRIEVKNVLVCIGDVREVTTCGVHDALWLTRCA